MDITSPSVQQFISSRRHVGEGVKTSPNRIIHEVHDFDGNFIAQKDPCTLSPESYYEVVLEDFIKFISHSHEMKKILPLIQLYIESLGIPIENIKKKNGLEKVFDEITKEEV